MLYKAANERGASVEIPALMLDIRKRAHLSQERLAQVLGVSFVSVNRWERGASRPSPALQHRITELHETVLDPWRAHQLTGSELDAFSSRGVRRQSVTLPIFAALAPRVQLSASPQPPVLARLRHGRVFAPLGEATLVHMLTAHAAPASTSDEPPRGGISAGKNTYTYDAHTYHTKVPPQGIAELLKHYLPEGGLVLDAFAGSGMTGVACEVLGYDCILNELSPAACFIAGRFVSRLDPAMFEAGTRTILDAVQDVRRELYSTTCRECGRPTEILYTVWSYRVLCNACGHEFLLWDRCRKYGKRVREHKILTEINCPACHAYLKKSQLKRTIAEPVQVGYMCCGSRQQEMTHPLNRDDLELVYRLELQAPVAEGYYPTLALPDGVNLRQPKRHGLDRIDRFYTPRNLAAMSHLWHAIHHLEDAELAGYMAFVFTSLYQRVTRLSEFRFWGGSGNTARFNVPYIFNEANVFTTFARKARTIQDHLETTATRYRGNTVVVNQSATKLDYLPDESVDLIFTDPPFGANINYSEMNILWEAWLQQFTETRDEAIVNKSQGKDVAAYQRLMTASLRECYRVLRPGSWLLLVFMNSSSQVWKALRAALVDAGFDICQADIFDKEHGTFKQFVSDNTAGCDLVLHCRKHEMASPLSSAHHAEPVERRLADFLSGADLSHLRTVYLHVDRADELDVRTLYSEWTAHAVLSGAQIPDFSRFREIVLAWLESHNSRG